MGFVKMYLLSKQFATKNAMPNTTIIFVVETFYSLENLNEYVKEERLRCNTNTEKKRIYSDDGGLGVYEIWIDEKNLIERKLSFPRWGKAIDLKFSNLIMVKFGILKENIDEKCFSPYLMPKGVDYDVLQAYLLLLEHKDNKQTEIKDEVARVDLNQQKPQENTVKSKLCLSPSSIPSAMFKTVRRVRFALDSHLPPNIAAKSESLPKTPLGSRKSGA